MKQPKTNSDELKKMEKDAVKLFTSASALIFAAAMYYAYKTGNMLCFYILAGAVGFLTLFLPFIFRSKK